MQGAIKMEEKKEEEIHSEKWILREHFKTLSLFLFLFLGFVFAFTFWSFILPPEKVSILFSIQNSVVNQIKSIAGTGNSTLGNTFFVIFLNNLKVLFLSLLFAFFYGAGAIFILVWNASVMGFVIGNLARNTFGIISLPVAFTQYFLHGIPEMFAYLTASLAGGVIYIAFIRGDLLEKAKAKKIIIDTSILVISAIFLLLIAALIEIYISTNI
jgi:uncharacterized membrane protein SpoIIM required for sporulation